MARSRTLVFSARHEVTTNLAATPAILIIGVGTTASRLMLTAETSLRRAHVGTWRARAGVTGQLTRMRTFADSFSTTSVSARMRRQTSDWARLNFFLAPAGVRLW